MTVLTFKNSVRFRSVFCKKHSISFENSEMPVVERFFKKKCGFIKIHAYQSRTRSQGVPSTVDPTAS